MRRRLTVWPELAVALFTGLRRRNRFLARPFTAGSGVDTHGLVRFNALLDAYVFRKPDARSSANGRSQDSEPRALARVEH